MASQTDCIGRMFLARRINKMYKFQIWLTDKLNNKKNVILLLLAIVVVGIFLRTYKHHDWLYFDDDQANDAIVVDNFLQGQTPLPELGPNMGNTNFHLGPIFYYFQVTSAELFGNYPDKLAYPDLLFSILAIPLFFMFLKKYFSTNLSLSLTGLYTISYFALKFSRFAWNTNSMPFFILLFFLALSEVLNHEKKTSWRWIVALGISIGVGIQLHAMLLVVFPIIAVISAIWLLKRNWRIAPRILAVVFIALLLNGGLIKHEIGNNFQNTRAFFKNADDRSGSGVSDFAATLAEDAACHIQANTYILATIGDKDNCNFLSTEKVKGTGEKRLAMLGSVKNVMILFLSILFSVCGYFLLAKRFWTEKETARKYFLSIIIIYLALFFVVMFASINEAPLRYFLPMFFVPYLFLGFIAEEIHRRISQKYFFVTVSAIFILIAVVNAAYLFSIATQLENKSRSGTNDVILGELENMRDYIIATSVPWHSAYLYGGNHYIFRFYRPMQYIAGKKDFAIERTGKVDNMTPGEPVFYIHKSYPGQKLKEIKGMKIITYKNFGEVAVYEVIKTK